MAIPIQFDRASDGVARASRGDYRQKGHLSFEALKRWRVHALAANRSASPLQRFNVLTIQPASLGLAARHAHEHLLQTEFLFLQTNQLDAAVHQRFRDA